MSEHQYTAEQFNGAITVLKDESLGDGPEAIVGLILDRERGDRLVWDRQGNRLTGTDEGLDIERHAALALERAAVQRFRDLAARQAEVDAAWAERIAAIRDTFEAKAILADLRMLALDGPTWTRYRDMITDRFPGAEG